MSVKILYDTDAATACLYDSTTERAFGDDAGVAGDDVPPQMATTCDCSTCASDRECLDCGESIPDTETAFYLPTDEDRRFWLGEPATTGPLCGSCKVKREDYEPPDPDGEAWRGGERAAFDREAQARIQRELK